MAVDVWSVILGGVVAVSASSIGAVINEGLRRSNRIESYSANVFAKRLSIYEGLLERLRTGNSVADEVMSNPDLTPEERHALISAVVLDIAAYTDEYDLYVDSDLGAHCTATFMGAEDVMSFGDETQREEARMHIRKMYQAARRMIRENSGVAGVDRLLKKIARPRLSGEFIDRLRHLRREHKRKR